MCNVSQLIFPNDKKVKNTVQFLKNSMILTYSYVKSFYFIFASFLLVDENCY